MPKFISIVSVCSLLAAPLAAQQHYQRQLGVDVQHYVWAVTLSDSTDEISGDATSDELRRDMEAASGRDLSWFFTNGSRVDLPVITGNWTWDAAAGQVVVGLTQTQVGTAYRLSVEFAVTPDSGATKVERFNMTQAQQRFTIAATRPPKDVSLDPDAWLLMDATFARIVPK